MSELSSKFSRDDLDTLFEAMDEWEASGNQEFYLLKSLKDAPGIAEDHPAYEMWQQIKDYYQKREKKIIADRSVRQEKAIFLKAKLKLVLRDMAIDQLFEMPVDASAPPVAKPDDVGFEGPAPESTPPQVASDLQASLDRAEFFIRDLGVWQHYEKFLAEKASI